MIDNQEWRSSSMDGRLSEREPMAYKLLVVRCLPRLDFYPTPGVRLAEIVSTLQPCAPYLE